MKCKNQPALVCPIGTIGASARPMAAFSGFLKALDLLHWAMRLILYRHIAMAIEMKSKVGTFCMVVLLLVALAAARAIRSKESPDGSVKWLLV